MIFYSGQSFVIEETSDAQESRPEAEGHAQASCVAQLKRLIQRFADFGSLKSPEQMNNEGDGIFAIKARCGLRAYGWYHPQRQKVFVISHYICKKKQKLDPADLTRAKNNRDSYGKVQNG